MKLRFHAKSIELLRNVPAVSAANSRLLDERESELGIRFPPAVREWYSLDESVELLRQHGDDVPVPLAKLGLKAADWFGGGVRDFVADGLLWIMTENQGVCNWAVSLDGTDDPQVSVEVDTAPNDQWKPFAASFSDFIFCRIWDYPHGEFACYAQDDLDGADLTWLQRTFDSEPTTYEWPGDVQYRFTTPHGRILLWFSNSYGTDWHLYSDTPEQFASLISQVWRCATLRESLYAHSNQAQAVLDMLRSRET